MTPLPAGFAEGLDAGPMISRIPVALVIGALVLPLLVLAWRAAHGAACKRLEVQFVHRAQTLAFLNECFASYHVKVLDVDFRAENHPDGSRYTNVYTLSMPRHASGADIVGALSENPDILNVVMRNA